MGQDFHPSDLSDVNINLVLLGGGLKGFVYISQRNVSYIFIEESLSQECIAETIAHETYHLKHDKQSHGIGLDQQGEDYEQRADRFAKKNYRRLLACLNTTPT